MQYVQESMVGKGSGSLASHVLATGKFVCSYSIYMQRKLVMEPNQTVTLFALTIFSHSGMGMLATYLITLHPRQVLALST